MNRRQRLMGIMVSGPNFRRRELSRYLRYASTGMKLFSFTPDDIDWERGCILGLHRTKRGWTRQRFPFPQAVYNRCYELRQETIERLEGVIGKNRCFNHINHLDKYRIYEHLSRWLADCIPETVRYTESEAVEQLLQHRLIFFKPCYGNLGKGVYRAELTVSGEVRIGDNHLRPKIVASDVAQFLSHMRELIGKTPYIVQRGVETLRLSGRLFDIRVLAQKNKRGAWSVTSAISRVAYKGCFNTSIFEKMCLSKDALRYLYPTGKADALFERICDVSMRAAEIIELDSGLHLGELSVDLAVDEEGLPWIIEVNGKPQKSLYNGFRHYRTAYLRPLEYANYLSRQGALPRQAARIPRPIGIPQLIEDYRLRQKEARLRGYPPVK